MTSQKKSDQSYIEEQTIVSLQNKLREARNESADQISDEFTHNLKMITEVFQKIEEETAEIAELIFEYLVNVEDEHILTGTVPLIDDEQKSGESLQDFKKRKAKTRRTNAYIKILNRLFLFSRKNHGYGGFRILNRKTVQELDKKTFTICMCNDGGVSLDILCDIVNAENQARTPSKSPVKVTVRQAFVNQTSLIVD
jgi:hypothetical protein